MFYTEVDSTGSIIRSQFVDESKLSEVVLLDPTNRLVPDQSPNPPEYDTQSEYAERQEPVLGDKVEYVIKKIPNAILRELDPKIAADLVIAKQFAENKGITGTVMYSLTNYNATTQQDIANVFAVYKYLIKVVDGQVSEFYESGVEVNGVQYAWVSRDTQTNDIIDKYVLTGNSLSKYTSDTAAEPVRTTFGGYNTIPDKLKPLLENFNYKNSIQLWSAKSYGFIVEYTK